MPTDQLADSNPEAVAEVRATVDLGQLAVLPQPPTAPNLPTPRSQSRTWLLLLVLLLGGVGGGYWWTHPRSVLPPGIAFSNGRLEADEIDIDTKYASRIAQLFVDEGDVVKARQVVARMDTQDLEASLRKSQALILQAEQTQKAAEAALRQQDSQVLLAQQEIARTQALVARDFAPRQTLDQQRQILVSATAGQAAAQAAILGAQHAHEAAMHDAELYQVQIADSSLIAPRDGRIEYRVANVGEVLPVGGKIFTMLDTGYVYMDIYLPTLEAGRVKLGSEARIVVDAYPGHPFPAKAVFVAQQAEFTPKTVETRDERDVLMFRVRLRIDAAAMAGHADDVRSGLPGMGYVVTQPGTDWPAFLQVDQPK